MDWTATCFDGLPGFSRFYVDHAANRLPSELQTLLRPESEGAWSRVFSSKKGRPIENSLGRALLLEHERLGAAPSALDSIRRLMRGEALAVVTGQQPGILGGPLFTRYKAATAVAAARRLSEDHGMPSVPVFWSSADDVDFDEVTRVGLPGRDLSVTSIRIPESERRPRSWVGDISGSATRALQEEAWAALGDPSSKRGAEWQEGVAGRARDFGDWTTAQYLQWFADDGLVVVDARLPEIRRAAVSLFRLYLERWRQVRDVVVGQGMAMEKEGYVAPISADAAEVALFLTPERRREKLPPAEVLAEARQVLDSHPSHLSPNVVLRPVVADAVLPCLGHVVGPAEQAYLSQLAPIYEILEVTPAVVMDRLSATLFPAEGLDLARDLDMRPPDVLADPKDALRRWYERQVPAELTESLETARLAIEEVFGQTRTRARLLDPSLAQLVDSARERTLFQLERLSEGFLKKIKHQRELKSPRIRSLPDFLLPRGRAQERELAGLSLEVLWGEETRANLMRLATDHVQNLNQGKRAHYCVRISS